MALANLFHCQSTFVAGCLRLRRVVALRAERHLPVAELLHMVPTQFHDLTLVAVFAFHHVTADPPVGAEPLTVRGLRSDTTKDSFGPTVILATENVAEPSQHNDTAGVRLQTATRLRRVDGATDFRLSHCGGSPHPMARWTRRRSTGGFSAVALDSSSNFSWMV
jgi:hypothetical protein